MKRLFLAILLLIVLGGGWWWQRARNSQFPQAWQALPGGGEVRLLAVSQGTVHRDQVLAPGTLERLSEAIRTRSTEPLRNPPAKSGLTTSITSSEPGLGVLLEWRGVAPPAQAFEGELNVPGGRTFYGYAHNMGLLGVGQRRMVIFHYIPVRAKTLRCAFDAGGQQMEFTFPNPAYRTDLPVWQGAPLPQTQEHGGLALTLDALSLQHRTDSTGSGRTRESWFLRPTWSVSQDGQAATPWYTLGITTEDPSGQMQTESALPDEPVWKVHCKLTRTNRYPYRDDEILWLGTAGPDAPPEKTTQLFTIDPQAQPPTLKLAGVFGPGVYYYQGGALVKTAARDETKPDTDGTIVEDPSTQNIRLWLDQPSVVVFGSASLISRDSGGGTARLEQQKLHTGPSGVRVTIYALPSESIRIGTAKAIETAVENFEFLVSTPDQPRLSRPPQ